MEEGMQTLVKQASPLWRKKDFKPVLIHVMN